MHVLATGGKRDRTGDVSPPGARCPRPGPRANVAAVDLGPSSELDGLVEELWELGAEALRYMVTWAVSMTRHASSARPSTASAASTVS